MTAHSGRGRRGSQKITLEVAQKLLCKALGDIAPSGDGFFATVKHEMERAKLNPSQCSRCMRMGLEITANDNELTGNLGSYKDFMYENTLKGLIVVLLTFAEMTEAEKAAVEASYTNRPQTQGLSVKTLAEYYADAIIEKCCALRGKDSPSYIN